MRAKARNPRLETENHMLQIRLAQLRGMAVYECRQLWRGKLMIALIAGFVLTIGTDVLLTGRNMRCDPGGAVDLATCQQAVMMTVTAMTLYMALPVAVLLPIMVAEVIPMDSQRGVRSWLDAMPLPASTYLLGKLLGTWLALTVAGLVAMLITGAILWLATGTLSLVPYIGIWLFGIIAVCLLNGGLGVLLPAGFATRRNAILWNTVWIIVLAGFLQGDDYRFYLNPLRLPVINYHIAAYVPFYEDTMGLGELASLLKSFAGGLLELAIVYFTAWVWLRWQSSRT